MGDILVFLTGQDDIDAAVQLLNEDAQNHGRHSSGWFPIRLSCTLMWHWVGFPLCWFAEGNKYGPRLHLICLSIRMEMSI